MAKKKKGSNLGKILYAVAAVLGLVAVAMLFVRAVSVPDVETLVGTIETDAGYTGFETVFGKSEEDVKILSFSFMALLPVLLAVAGIVLSALQATSKKGSKLFDLVIVACFVVAGVLYFIMPSFLVFADNIVAKALAEIDYTLGVGSIVAAISSIVAGVVVLAKTLLKK